MNSSLWVAGLIVLGGAVPLVAGRTAQDGEVTVVPSRSLLRLAPRVNLRDGRQQECAGDSAVWMGQQEDSPFAGRSSAMLEASGDSLLWLGEEPSAGRPPMPPAPPAPPAFPAPPAPPAPPSIHPLLGTPSRPAPEASAARSEGPWRLRLRLRDGDRSLDLDLDTEAGVSIEELPARPVAPVAPSPAVRRGGAELSSLVRPGRGRESRGVDRLEALITEMRALRAEVEDLRGHLNDKRP